MIRHCQQSKTGKITVKRFQIAAVGFPPKSASQKVSQARQISFCATRSSACRIKSDKTNPARAPPHPRISLRLCREKGARGRPRCRYSPIAGQATAQTTFPAPNFDAKIDRSFYQIGNNFNYLFLNFSIANPACAIAKSRF